MTSKRIFVLPFIIVTLSIIANNSFADGPYGDRSWRKQGVMDGNLVRTIFLNHGEVALWPFQPSCEWPKGSGHSYIDGVAPWVAAEVVDIHGNTIHPLQTNYREYIDRDPETGLEWGWQPLPGYANINQDFPAMSNNPETWPWRWPDKPDWFDQETGKPLWNGYFGMGVTNADLETYFVMDDAVDVEFDFYPDASDSTRRGLGLKVAVRGFQWSHVLAEDCIFWHYDITNLGTTDYPNALFGMYIDFGIGGTQDSDDDFGEYDTSLDITFAWDGNGLGKPGDWGPVGVAGYAFLESPGVGNVYDEFGALIKEGDGIDNDEDGLLDESRNNPPGEYIFGPVGIYGPPKWHWEGDEDGDWDSFSDLNTNGKWDEGELLNDDLGADGVGPTDEQYPGPDEGEGDGIPTDGEPDFNQTDKDESDQIGLTSVKIFNLHEYDLYLDEEIWNIMAYNLFDTGEEDVNLGALYASGPFSLKAGQTERFSMALLFGEDRQDLMRNKIIVQGIYNANYNFARPPDKPTVHTAVGDRRVTLYWDRKAENSYDRFLGKYDFEGYRIYRSTDPAFLEPKVITDTYGIKTLRKPIFQCDLANFNPDTLWWVKGPHPVGINGIQFDMGDDTGLVHSWIDSTVVNGQTYYYAVVSYDQGFPPPRLGEIGLPPTECTTIIRIDELGYVNTTDINTVVVTPRVPAAGYKPPQQDNIQHSGPGTGFISIEILNQMDVKDYHTYKIAFSHSDLFQTTHYSVYAITSSPQEKLVDNSPYIGIDSLLVDPIKRRYQLRPQDGPVFDGMRILVYNDELAYIDSLSGWIAGDCNYSIEVYPYNPNGVPYPADYEIRFEAMAVDTSTNNKPANFKVWNVTEQRYCKFYFKDLNNNGIPDRPNQDFIYIWETINGENTKTWQIYFNNPSDGSATPEPMEDGDVLLIHTSKPFRGDYGDGLSGDGFTVSTKAAYIQQDIAKTDLDKIAVVPNPYVAAASWEAKSLYFTGRGERKIEFIHLPEKCTIRIYTVRGYLVQTIEHDKDIDDGSEFWNLRTKDRMDVAYGLYIYHIDAPGIGEKIGKFAIIK